MSKGRVGSGYGLRTSSLLSNFVPPAGIGRSVVRSSRSTASSRGAAAEDSYSEG
jgi:hypothetical protein